MQIRRHVLCVHVVVNGEVGPCPTRPGSGYATDLYNAFGLSSLRQKLIRGEPRIHEIQEVALYYVGDYFHEQGVKL